MLRNRLQVGQAPGQVLVVYEQDGRPLLHSFIFESGRSIPKWNHKKAEFERVSQCLNNLHKSLPEPCYQQAEYHALPPPQAAPYKIGHNSYPPAWIFNVKAFLLVSNACTGKNVGAAIWDTG